MTPDITERLRDSAKQARAIDRSALLIEAAGVIDKLRSRLRLADAVIRSSLDYIEKQGGSDDNGSREAERTGEREGVPSPTDDSAIERRDQERA